jgi:hypothetical protein
VGVAVDETRHDEAAGGIDLAGRGAGEAANVGCCADMAEAIPGDGKGLSHPIVRVQGCDLRVGDDQVGGRRRGHGMAPRLKWGCPEGLRAGRYFQHTVRQKKQRGKSDRPGTLDLDQCGDAVVRLASNGLERAEGMT